MGIRLQLTLLIPSVVAIALALGTEFSLRNERRGQVQEFIQLHLKVLEVVGVSTATHLDHDERAGLEAFIGQAFETLERRELLEMTVLDGSGEVLATTNEDSSPALNAIAREAVTSMVEKIEHQDGVLSMCVPVRAGQRTATVCGRYSTEHIERQFQRTRQQFWSVTLVLFSFIGSVLFLGIERLVVRPLRMLQAAMRRISEGSLSHRVQPLVGKEINEVGEMMNHMAQTLQSERDNLEQSVAERTKELQELNLKLQRLAVTDGLTGVFNHRRFQESLHSELLRCERHKRPLGLLMIDVDFFKKVNDAMGHPAGDELLRRLAEVLGTDLRQTDMIARYGGEEFAVLLPETSKLEAIQVGERMRAAVELTLNAEKKWNQTITVSVGVATFPEDGKTAEEVLRAADDALYMAKRQGRNRVIGARAAAVA